MWSSVLAESPHSCLPSTFQRFAFRLCGVEKKGRSKGRLSVYYLVCLYVNFNDPPLPGSPKLKSPLQIHRTTHREEHTHHSLMANIFGHICVPVSVWKNTIISVHTKLYLFYNFDFIWFWKGSWWNAPMRYIALHHNNYCNNKYYTFLHTHTAGSTHVCMRHDTNGCLCHSDDSHFHSCHQRSGWLLSFQNWLQ